MLVTAVHAAAQPALQHGAAPRACCAARCSPAGVPATPPKLTGHSRLSPPPPLPQSSLSAASLVIWLVRLDRSLCTLASSLRSATLSARAAAGGRGAMHRMGGGGGYPHYDPSNMHLSTCCTAPLQLCPAALCRRPCACQGLTGGCLPLRPSAASVADARTRTTAGAALAAAPVAARNEQRQGAQGGVLTGGCLLLRRQRRLLL